MSDHVDHLHYKHEYKELVKNFEFIFDRQPTEYEKGVLAGICAYKENMTGIIDGKNAMNTMAMLENGIDYRKNKEPGEIIPIPQKQEGKSKPRKTVKKKTIYQTNVISFSECLDKILGWTE